MVAWKLGIGESIDIKSTDDGASSDLIDDVFLQLKKLLVSKKVDE